ncbi:hypothetical protein [Actibacterium sp. 188UL27-1]|uniref:hypothetical protein n=1 Tax=Actibacterium sp. 188UL27-1 TaxID=2786961 RepID=UPI001959F449|nr:hypothetical protein [Actibacterium sp. 188UL27-1]MBM7067120.1 hypothetical protein [Actibacterium sp. 188UL27-1]
MDWQADGDDLTISSVGENSLIPVGLGQNTIIGSDSVAEDFRFVFTPVESDPQAPDVIFNLQQGQNEINFAETPALNFIGDGAFNVDDTVLQARYENGTLEFDRDGDGDADLAVVLVWVDDLTADDFGFA